MVCTGATRHPSLVSPFGGIPFLVIAAGAAAYLAFRLRGGNDNPSPIKRNTEVAAIIFLTVSAFLLRGPGIGTNPPGVWVDEAVEGFQAGAALAGEQLPDVPDAHVVYPRWPAWWMLERLSVKFGGMTASAVRAPAVIVGTLTIPLAWWLGRALAGPLAGLASAAFLAFSFWHIQLSRIGVAPVLLVPEVLLAGWLLFARAPRRPQLAGLGAGAVCAVACLDYPAALALPIWAALVAMLRIVFPEQEGNSRGRAYGFWILGGLAVCGAFLFLAPGIHLTARLGRMNAVGLAAFPDILAQSARCLANHFIPVANTFFIWDGFPPGTPRFSPVENFAWLTGLAAIFAAPGIPVWFRLALASGIPVLLLPEILPGTSGGVYLVRGAASLGLISILAGAGARVWGPAVGRAGLGVLATVSVVSAWHSAGMTYGPLANSSLSRRIYSGVALEVANGIRSLAREKPVAVFPPLSYADNPQIAFHLWNEIRAGLVMEAGEPPREDRVLSVYRDPVGAQPVVVLVVSRDFARDRIVGLLDVQASMMEGQAMERAGRWREAAEAYQMVAKFVPDYWQARAGLGLVLIKQGNKTEGLRILRGKDIPEKFRARRTD